MNRFLCSLLFILMMQKMEAQIIRPSLTMTYNSTNGTDWKLADSTIRQYDQPWHVEIDTTGLGRFILDAPLVEWSYVNRFNQTWIYTDSIEYNPKNQIISRKTGQVNKVKFYPNQWEETEYTSDGNTKWRHSYLWDIQKNAYSPSQSTYWEYDFIQGDSTITNVFFDEKDDTTIYVVSRFIKKSKEIDITTYSRSTTTRNAFYGSRLSQQFADSTWKVDSIIETTFDESGNKGPTYIYSFSIDSLGHYQYYNTYYLDYSGSTLQIVPISSNKATYLTNGYIASWVNKNWDVNSQQFKTAEIIDYSYGAFGLAYTIFQQADGNGGFAIYLTDSIFYHTSGLPMSEKQSQFNAQFGSENHSWIYYFYPDSATGFTKIPEEKLPLKIFPNPGTDIINISQLKPGDVLRIYGMDGKEMLNQKMYETLVQIDTQNWPAGLYFINGQRWVKD